jgi:hypothetical protein
MTIYAGFSITLTELVLQIPSLIIPQIKISEKIYLIMESLGVGRWLTRTFMLSDSVISLITSLLLFKAIRTEDIQYLEMIHKKNPAVAPKVLKEPQAQSDLKKGTARSGQIMSYLKRSNSILHAD